MYRFEGKVIAVTGAASGIGLAVARLLAAEGANLSLADLDPESLKEIIKEPVFQGREILTAAVDVRERRQVQQWIDPTIKRFKKPIDGAANIAGVVGKHHGLDNGSIRNISEAEFNFVLDINLQGLFNCLAIELPAMKTGTQGVCRGSIVNTASVGGLVGIPNASPYVASKHAVLGLTKTAAKEEGPRCIRVNAVAPGVTWTPMIEAIERRDGTTEKPPDAGAFARKGTPGEVANLIMFLLSDESSFITGAVYTVDGGLVC